MSLQVATGTFLIDSAWGDETTHDIAGLGFNPKAIIFWSSGRPETIDATGRLTAMRSIGFCRGSGTSFTRAAVAARSGNNTTAAEVDGSHSEVALNIEITGTPVLSGYIDMNDMSLPANDGFRIIVKDPYAASRVCHYFAIGGDDVTGTSIIQITETTTGVINYATMGIDPSIVFLIGAGSTAAPADPPGTFADGRIMFSANKTTAGDGAWVVHTHSDDGSAAMDTGSYGLSTQSIGIMSTSNPTSITDRATFNGLISGGFSLNWSEALSANRYWALGIAGGTWKVGEGATVADTTTDIALTGLGTTAKGVLVASCNIVESTVNVGTLDAFMSIGASTAADTGNACAYVDENGEASSVITISEDFDKVYIRHDVSGTVPSGAANIVGLAKCKSMDSDGVTLIMTDADPVPAWFGAVMVGDTIVGGGSEDPFPYQGGGYYGG